MTQKYQKPSSRSLGELETAEGSCGTGFTVRSVCSGGSNYTVCSAGPIFDHGLPCPSFGASATACNPTGITANI
jgi:hypothetical protein